MNIKKLAKLCAILIFSLTLFAQGVSADSKKQTEDFVASEMEYAIEAQQSVKWPSEIEMDKIETDRLTGKSWSEAEQQTSHSEQESTSTQFNEADFLDSESEYIAKAKMTSKKRNKGKDNVDPMSGKTWEEIEADIK